MNQFEIGGHVFRHDREHTRNAYAAMKGGDAERCGCAYCRNFAAQRTTVYPESFRLLLTQLGVDPEKEGEVYECGPEGLLRVYGGWFYFIGELVQAGERMTDDASGFQFWLGDAQSLPRPAVDFGKNVLAIEFLTKIPWVISDLP